jgi:myo-inositol 2-dehydrogenase/D-chiro-inositol 1-dehydrogenase
VVAPSDVQQASGLVNCPVGSSIDQLVDNPGVDAVVIVSPSSLHDEHIARVAAAGKPIFCEKPLAGSVEKAERAVRLVEEAGIPFQTAYQRRFDPGYARAKQMILAGAIGTPEMFRGISCDYMPPLSYLRTSGGLFWDLGVHDFDAARFLMGEEITAVHATGVVQVEPGLAALQDIDYGIVSLRFQSGAVGVVQNSWRAPWGYEIRAEVYGSAGKVVTELDERIPIRLYTERGALFERHHKFVERFREAYHLELQAFVDALHAGSPPSPDALDGLRGLQIADAATRSHRENRWVEIAQPATAPTASV